MNVTRHTSSTLVLKGLCFWVGCIIMTYTAHPNCNLLYNNTVQNYNVLLQTPVASIKFEDIHSTFESLLQTFSKCPDKGVDAVNLEIFSEENLKSFFKKYYALSLERSPANMSLPERREFAYGRILLKLMSYPYDNKDRFLNTFIKRAEETFRKESEVSNHHVLKIFFYDILNVNDETGSLQDGLLSLLQVSETSYKATFELLDGLVSKEIFSPGSQLTKKKESIAYNRKRNEMDEAGEVEAVKLQDVLEGLMLDLIHEKAVWVKGSKAAFLKKVNAIFQQKGVERNKTSDPSKNPDPSPIPDFSSWKKNAHLFQKISEAIVDSKKKTGNSERRYRDSNGYGGRGGSYGGGRGGGGRGGGGGGGGGGRGGPISFQGTGLLGEAQKSFFAEEWQRAEQESGKEKQPSRPTSTFLKSSGMHTNASKIKKVSMPKATKNMPNE